VEGARRGGEEGEEEGIELEFLVFGKVGGLA